MNEKRVLVFDMDGTIADLYSVTNWLADLRNFNPRPYIEASPLCDMVKLEEVLNRLKSLGWIIVITSWLSKESNKEYDKKVREAKRNWLCKYNFPADEIHFVKYGTPKANCTRKYGSNRQILIDDNSKVREGWRLGPAVDPDSEDIIQFLEALYKLG